MSPLEYAQYLLLVAMSWTTPSGDLYDAACLGTNFIFTGYHDALCPERRSWRDIKESTRYTFYYPRQSQGELPGKYPLVILFHGVSSAHTVTMEKRRRFFLSRGYAVMVVDSYSQERVLAGLPQNVRNKMPSCETKYTEEEKHWVMHLFQERVTQGYALTPSVRAVDVYVALDAAYREPKVDSSNMSLVGYSHGASTILEALTLAYFRKTPPGAKDTPINLLDGVRSVVLYYPSCRPGIYFHWLRKWPAIPTLMILGKRDSLCRMENCQNINTVINKKAGYSVIQEEIYDAPHNFDMEEFPDDYYPKVEALAKERTMKFLESCN
ncbi:hypothetical protein [Parendozoicomonas sp. Alg238-R29]|uniref:dienelactone hydrolase family protein n=1 Tax=Parendozoicomonas sp. Alg238-R29 TaxID=2993446 RepID=UPI00248E0F8A|nr:hypothetical protein [Parendozoicomonas sp. Alg238-R29]